MKFQVIRLAHKVFQPVSACSKKSPIILMHGLMDEKETWEPIPQLLADETKRRVYTYDARNHGCSEHTLEVEYEYNVFDLLCFTTDMQLRDSVVLVGNNMGGMTAIRTALELPTKVETAFIVDMSTLDMSKKLIEHYTARVKEYYDGIMGNTDIHKLKIYTHPPPREQMMKEEFVQKSVLVIRYAAMIQAFRKHEEKPPTPLKGLYYDPVYFLYDDHSKCLTEETMDETRKDILRYFPKASFKNFQKGVFADPELFVKYIVDKLPPPTDFYSYKKD